MECHPEGLRAVLLRLHATNDALVCWNADRDLRVVLRNEPQDDDTLSFQLGLMPAKDSAAARAMELDLLEGYFDDHDDSFFVVEHYEFPRADVESDAATLSKAAERVGAVLAYRMCPCGEFLIKDGAPQCMFCDLVAGRDDDELDCAICHEAGPLRQLEVSRCCRNAFHKACLSKWRGPCPTCRAPRAA
jgi:hypothetical protein